MGSLGLFLLGLHLLLILLDLRHIVHKPLHKGELEILLLSLG